jgi:hypothetical protein
MRDDRDSVLFEDFIEVGVVFFSAYQASGHKFFTHHLVDFQIFITLEGLCNKNYYKSAWGLSCVKLIEFEPVEAGKILSEKSLPIRRKRCTVQIRQGLVKVEVGRSNSY